MLYVSSDVFRHQSHELAHSILQAGKKYDAILCVTKGWMHLAYYLADVLKIKNIRTYCCSSYMTDNNQWAMNVYYQPDLADLHDANILVVDDLIDSGKTLQHIWEAYPEYNLDVAVLYTKEKHWLKDVSTKKHHIYAFQENLPADAWISFYYEEE